MQKSKSCNMLVVWLSLLVLTGCQTGQTLDNQSDNPLAAKQTNYSVIDQDTLNGDIYNQFEDIVDVTSISNNDELIMAIKVDQLAQFNEQKIAKEVQSYLKKSNEDIKPKVSSDLKIYIEIDRLKQQLADQDLSKSDFDKLFDEIIQLIEGK
ncbi:hypothetical protein SAMN04488134_101575 [Amphibacillus marinus]|uniref:Sporulation lipoprotein YhcN/YlaJ (Spore_YhcN_YlaJ) n=1 Tax=Amphibacillus marinus TaxID=872970 RepID=A0A1H8IBU8_9BACI|nr:hypothetical protein [Amphibacillus marinus]SEN65801.1 hypothetical protein SAMN04488134_101575 [Amphibacillus marinus]